MAKAKGAPKTGGRKKGSKNKATIEKLELKRIFEQRIAEEFGPLVDAHLEAAKGVSHMMAKDKAGKWIEVTDPATMAKVLNSGEAFYRISARNPDIRALKELWDRTWGAPTQGVDLTVTDVTKESTSDLVTKALALTAALTARG